jgi:hypothetical protein
MPDLPPAPTVTDLWRFPVKSMRGERIDALTLTSRGVAGDRAFAILDRETEKLATASNVRHFPGLLACQATVVQSTEESPVVRIDLPDGTSVRSDSVEVDKVLSAFFGRAVSLVRSGPPSWAANQTAFFADTGVVPSSGVGTLVDLYPVSMVTAASLAQFAALAPESRFDRRRFRMNIILATGERGFPENTWVGRSVGFTSSARLHVALPDPRCAMTTLPQDDLPADAGVLRAIATHNSLPIGTRESLPCAGVYAEVSEPGMIRIGDRVTIE